MSTLHAIAQCPEIVFWLSLNISNNILHYHDDVSKIINHAGCVLQIKNFVKLLSLVNLCIDL